MRRVRPGVRSYNMICKLNQLWDAPFLVSIQRVKEELWTACGGSRVGPERQLSGESGCISSVAWYVLRD